MLTFVRSTREIIFFVAILLGRFSKINILQGRPSVATQLKFGGILMTTLLHIFCKMWQWKLGRSQEFDLGGYKSKAHTGHWHDIESVLGQGDKTTT